MLRTLQQFVALLLVSSAAVAESSESTVDLSEPVQYIAIPEPATAILGLLGLCLILLRRGRN